MQINNLCKLDVIEKSVGSMDLKLSSIDTRVSKLETSITYSNKHLLELEESRTFDSEMGDELKSTVMAMETQLTAERSNT